MLTPPISASVPNTVGTLSSAIDVSGFSQMTYLTGQVAGAAASDTFQLYGGTTTSITATSKLHKLDSFADWAGAAPVDSDTPLRFNYLYILRTGGASTGLTATFNGAETPGTNGGSSGPSWVKAGNVLTGAGVLGSTSGDFDISVQRNGLERISLQGTTTRFGNDATNAQSVFVGNYNAGSETQLQGSAGILIQNLGTGANVNIRCTGGGLSTSTNGFTCQTNDLGADFTATTTGGFTFTPGPTGAVSFPPRTTGAGGTTPVFWRELAANGVNTVGFKAPDAIAANVTWVLPNADATIANQALTSDAAGNLSWRGAVNVQASTTNAQSIADGGGAAIVTTWTEVTDTANAFNAATGVFTAPVTGFYHITAQVEFAAIASVVGGEFTVQIFKNGTVVESGVEIVQVAAANVKRNPKVTLSLQLAATNTIDIRVSQTSGSGANALTNSTSRNVMSIAQIN